MRGTFSTVVFRVCRNVNPKSPRSEDAKWLQLLTPLLAGLCVSYDRAGWLLEPVVASIAARDSRSLRADRSRAACACSRMSRALRRVAAAWAWMAVRCATPARARWAFWRHAPAAVARVGATVEHGATHQALQPRSRHNGNVTPIHYSTLSMRRNLEVHSRIGAGTVLTPCQ